ncbi:uncharacterized protein LOC122963397 [Acropora millepora]|uniref:uncharacterized protein LOC122963397 n=1 Tax=Acropora millepora TaxID=45264 RepID=UPI001CF5FD31|nr:uncharacterized protein LOC122963397 [Acropora millepora]
MSSFTAAILKATVGLLVNKGRNVAAEKLKEGDVTNEQLRNLMVSELDDIKSKLDGIARKDVLTSIGFFKEGLVYLYKVKPNEEDGKKTQQREDRAATPLKQEVESSEASGKTVSVVDEMRSLRLTDTDNSTARALNDAKDRFKQAREKATQAFYNEALSTSDRILAMQYRIMATILEKVDCVPDAVAACRLCLEELHSMPAVKKSLDVHLQKGFKSMFNKVEREDTIRSVCRINRVIFHIAQIVEEDNDITLWPCIDSGEYKVDPLRDVRVTQTIEKDDPQYFLLKTWPFFQEGEDTMNFCSWLIAINWKGQLMIAATENIGKCTLLKVFDRNGNLLQSLELKPPVTESNDYFAWRIIGIASDRSNNVFILTSQTLNRRGCYRKTVIVFDRHGNFQHEFVVNEDSVGYCFAVSDDSMVFVSAKLEEKIDTVCVLVYNFNGVLLNIFEEELWTSSRNIASVGKEAYRIAAVGGETNLFALPLACQFSEQGKLLSWYKVSSNGSGRIPFLHKTAHVVELDYSIENLLLYNKDGMVAREIKLKPSALIGPRHKPEFTVTTQGLVATLTTDHRTGKRMIAIL